MSLYLEYRAEISTGDALQWRSSTLLGWAIRLFAKPKKENRGRAGYDVNHTSLAITFSEYDQYRRYTTEALEHGIDLNLLSRRLREYKGEVYWLPLMLRYNYCRPAIGKIALSHMGIDYDYKSLLRQTHSRVRPDRKQLFCSEHYFIAVRAGFNINGVELLDSMEKAPRPCDIPDLGIFEEPIRIK